MSKHTPGPWACWSGYNPYDKIEAQITADGGEIVIASYNHLIPEGEANARLMAAAPIMLKALKDAYSHICKQSPRVENGFVDGSPAIICRDDLSGVVRLMGKISVAIELAECSE